MLLKTDSTDPKTVAAFQFVLKVDSMDSFQNSLTDNIFYLLVYSDNFSVLQPFWKLLSNCATFGWFEL